MGILLVSAVLRIQLAYQGGQYYWPDERRYGMASDALHAAFAGNWGVVKQEMMGSSDHFFFRFISLGPALLDRWLIPPEAPSLPFAAAILSMFGVGSILIVWLIMRDALQDEHAATWGAFFYAGSVTALFLSRHYFPYDPSIFLILSSWWLGRRGESSLRHWLTGCLAGLGYLTYNAYWNLAGLILVFHVLRGPWDYRLVLRRGICAGLGVITPMLGMLGAGHLAGYDLLDHAVKFSHTVTLGGFGRGWWLMLSYFAEAEGAYLALLLVVIAAGLVVALWRRQSPAGAMWLIMGGVLVGEMILLSDVIHRFALSGRMIKPLMIFVSMGAGAITAQFLRSRSGWWRGGLIVATVVLAWMNFTVPFRLQFPAEFRKLAHERSQEELNTHPGAVLQIYYADFMHRASFIPELPPHVELLRSMHPVQYRPYQFEGYDEDVRNAFATNDFAMRLVRINEQIAWQQQPAKVASALAPYTGAMEIKLKLPAIRPVARAEPLVVGGVTGAADLISIYYPDTENVEIFIDHWGGHIVRSRPFSVPAGADAIHTLTLSAGTLLPPAGHAAVQANPELAMLVGKLIVSWNGRMVMKESSQFYPVPKAQVTVGKNNVGGSTTGTHFTGKILQVACVDPRLVVQPDWETGRPVANPVGWQGTPGPLLVSFEWHARNGAPVTQDIPVLTAHKGLLTLSVTARWDGEAATFIIWRQNEVLAIAPPVPIADGAHQLLLWIPLLMPSPERIGRDESSLLAWARNNLLLKLDDQVVLATGLTTAVPLVENVAGTMQEAPVYLTIGQTSPLETPSSLRLFPGRITKVEAVDRKGPVLLRALWQDRMEGPFADLVSLGPLRMKVKFPPARVGAAEPLVSTGSTGVADVIFVRYLDGGRVQFSHDHWGSRLLESPPVSVDMTAEHVIDISIGSLYPPEQSLWAAAFADSPVRACRVFVALDGVTMLQGDRHTYDTSLANIAVGRNVAGVSTVAGEFSGEIRSIQQFDPKALPEAARLDAQP